MSTDNLFEVAPEGRTSPFNALESAAPSALKEFPLIPENRTTTTDLNNVGLYDPSQTQPFAITDAGGRVIATAPDARNGIYDITNGSIGSPDGMFRSQGCSGCGCSEYVATGWNRSQFFASRNQYAYSDGDDDIGDGYDPSDGDGGDDYYPDDDGGGCDPGGGCGPGGFLRGLLSRFGRGGLLRGLFGGGGCGGGMRFGRFLGRF
ncbi:MAG: hypothetical protein K2X93_16420 [Candidatus Obscuribacterales bacterium]|nr:hypothetical protein [Candidatus Obscuribacterales bacterium]